MKSAPLNSKTNEIKNKTFILCVYMCNALLFLYKDMLPSLFRTTRGIPDHPLQLGFVTMYLY